MSSAPPHELFRGRTPSRWSLYRDGLSSSLLSEWLQCREHFRLRNVEGWRPKAEAPYFEFGNAVHWVLRRLYTVANQLHALKAAERSITELNEYETRWFKSRPRLSTKHRAQMEQVFGLAAAVLPAYAARYAGDFCGGQYPVPTEHTKIHRWIGVEKPFEFKFRLSDDIQIPFRGRWDAVFDNARMRRWLFDTKCYSVIDEETLAESLPFNFQMNFYLWAHYQAEGTYPEGLILNVVRRLGVKQKVGETLRSMLKRATTEYAHPANYNHNFKRIQLTVDKRDIVRFEETILRPALCDLVDWWHGEAPHYMNPHALVTKFGRSAYFDLIVNGQTSEYYQVAAGQAFDYHVEGI